ncbi:Mu transposase C-terminal domain-containing protein [Alteromonas sp. ASW11-130]|uniref:Mu transposase C-terminal domain-containing protein n=1 Tax=Alteromonas sp. ASW11-130 TaxID=3015775 RepID=UPI002241A7C9|nr:Mu transposase C-terminal domain-containing protein [Alteromonas sp. ASW11-130]MCW8093219.1 Mu transposase C-terminal domain-containing protein [Alteromonas sp. ASW11-130]
MLLVNVVIKHLGRHFRVLDVRTEHCFWIDIHEKYADPEPFEKHEIAKALSTKKAEIVEDPFSEAASQKPSDSQQQRLEEIWQVMQKVNNHPLRLYRHAWPNLYREVIENSEITYTKKHFYTLLRKFLQRGQNKNALLPDFNKQGAPNKPRKISTKKVGRTRTVTVGTGIPITEEIKVIFRNAIDSYYLNSTRMPWSKILKKVELKFRQQFPNVSSRDYPTITQLKHLFSMEYKAADTAKARSSQITYEKDVRQLTSTATAQVLGPGDRYEFDATIIDLYLVSEIDPTKIIGRPTLLLVIDVFSRLVTGYYLTFEPASYVLAMMSIANCLENKVDVCRRLGISIDFEDWPAIGLPTAILADKGELLTHQAESLVNTYNVRIENAKARRGDAKGIVEQRFRTIQADFIPYTPGAVTTETVKKRGGKDYRLDAQLTLRQLEEILVLLIYKHNLNVMSKYDADSGIPESLPRTPKNLWQWGIENRSGALKNASLEDFKIHTLPREMATVSNEGIKFQSLTYSCPEAFKLGWFLRDKHRTRPQKVEIGYDPRTTNSIYIFPEGQKQVYWVANLTDRSRAFQNMTFYEAKQTIRKIKLSGDAEVKANKDKLLDAEQAIEKRIEAAKKQGRLSTDNTSARAKLSAIKGNKKEAIAEERKNRSVGAETRKADAQVPDNVAPIVKTDDFSHPDIPDDIYGDED